MTGLADPFDTAGLRARVLDAWAASPSRFREDANAEEDYALGGYRDRVVVELAQNAADAAVRGGVPGRLRLTLRDGVLTALNAGVPLDAAGVEALSTLRASSKRGDGAGSVAGAAETVGRFGVGFAAVVAVSDSPCIRSTTGTVSWSRHRSRELASAVPALAGEIAARSGHVPVLRLPFAGLAAAEPPQPQTATGRDPSGWPDGSGTEGGSTVPDGFATAVELPLRDEAAVELVRRLLTETGPALLLALPALAQVEITVDGVTRLLTARHDNGLSTITISGVASLACTRCLEDFSRQVTIPFGETYREDGVDDPDALSYHGDEIDIAEPVREALIMAEPLKPLCREDCQGLCPRCGVNRNETPCACGSDDIDPRLAALAKLLPPK